MTRGRLANHAHVIQDGHLHDELGLGHLDPTTAFAAAIVRNPDGEMSAHSVRDRWQAATPEREQTREGDRRTAALQQWWNRQVAAMPGAARDALAGQHHHILDRLSQLDPTVVTRTVQRAATLTDWVRPDAATRFLGLLNPASRDTANWWSHQFRQLGPEVRRQLAPHNPTILAALADHPTDEWPNLVHQARTRTHWDHHDAPAQFLAALDRPRIRPDRLHQPSSPPARGRSH